MAPMNKKLCADVKKRGKFDSAMCWTCSYEENCQDRKEKNQRRMKLKT